MKEKDKKGGFYGTVYKTRRSFTEQINREGREGSLKKITMATQSILGVPEWEERH